MTLSDLLPIALVLAVFALTAVTSSAEKLPTADGFRGIWYPMGPSAVSGGVKRFKYSGSGKLMRTRGPKSHLRRNKSARAKAQFDQMVPVQDSQRRKRIMRLAPYLKKYSTTSSRRGGGSKK